MRKAPPAAILTLGVLIGVAGTLLALQPPATAEPANAAVDLLEHSSPPRQLPAATPAIELYFSPGGGATDAIVREIDGARRRIRVLAYSFTSAPIAKALADAHARGVDVQVVLDKSQRSERYTSATFLANHGVPVLIDARHAIQHNKVILIDAETVITGSFNFSKAAEERNAENLLVIRDAELMERYLANWREHRGHAEVYQRG